MAPGVEALLQKQAEQYEAATAFMKTQADAIDRLADGLRGVLLLCDKHPGGAVPVADLLAVLVPAVMRTNEAVIVGIVSATGAANAC